MSVSSKDAFGSFRRSWVHQTGMQLATLSVLTATFAVVVFVCSLSLNLNRVLMSFGERVQISAYLAEDVSRNQTKIIESQIEKIAGVAKVSYVSREVATDHFRNQIASYAPDLLSDADFANPFPASFRITLQDDVQNASNLKAVEEITQSIGSIEGVEDVSYGQSWVKNYSSFVSTLAKGGATLIAILLFGGLFVIANSVRASIGSRREEIEILELIGATAAMIRKPYIIEGAMMGALAASAALVLNFGLYMWQISLLSSSLALGRIANQFSFFGIGLSAAVVLAGGFVGGLGAFMTLRKINDGWSAAGRTSASGSTL